MKTTDVPFNKHLDIKKESKDSDFLLSLDAQAKHMNHLGSIHASVLFSLAEAASGEFLLNNFKNISNKVIPVVRKAEVKFRKVVNRKISAKAGLVGTTKKEVLDELTTRKRALVKVKADIYDIDFSIVFSSVFEWFIVMDSQKI